MTKLKAKKTYHQELSISDTRKAELDRFLELSESEEAITLLRQCIDETDSFKQASLLKKVGSLVTRQDTKERTSSAAQQHLLCVCVLAELFVTCDAKNPARRTVASVLDNLSVDCIPEAQTSLSMAVSNKIGEGTQVLLQKSGPRSFCVREFTDLISSLLENFQLGARVVALMGFSVIEFLGLCLERLVAEASVESTSVAQTSLMMTCLVCIKTIISVLQRCSHQPGSSFHGDSRHSNNGQSTDVDHCTPSGQEESRKGKCAVQPEEWNSVLAGIMEQLLTVLTEESFLPDCRSAAGMAIPLIVRTACGESQPIPVIVKTFFPSYLRSDRTVQVSSPLWLSNTMKKNPSPGNASFTLLCLCHGCLTMLPRHALLLSSEVIRGSETEDNRTLLYDVLFPVLCDLCERLKESSSCLSVFRTLALWTEEARAVATSRLPGLKPRLVGPADIPQKLLGFVWSHWDHPVEGVRHNTRAIFDSVIKMHSALSQVEPSSDVFLKNLIESLINVDWHMRGKYGPLCSVATAVGARCMLEWYPDIPRDVLRFVGDRAVAPHVIEFIEKLTLLHKKDISLTGGDLDEWLHTWIIPVLDNLRWGNKEMRARLTEYCLPKLLKCCPESLHFIVDRLRSQERDADASYLGSLITCLKTARNLGFIDTSKKCSNMGPPDASARRLWAGVVPMELLQKCLCNIDDQIRLDALALLCECPKTTEPVTEADMELLRIYVALNMNSQSPPFRQLAAASIRKLFFRFKECMRILKKDIRKDQGASHKAARLSAYKDFLHWFCELQFFSVFPGSSFARRNTALYNLLQVKKVFGDDDANDSSTPAFRLTDVMSNSNIRVLFDCLRDSYDVNKLMAHELLASCPADLLPFQTPESLAVWLRKTERLMTSPRAVDTLSAAVLMRLLIDKCSLPLRFHDNAFDEKKNVAPNEEEPDKDLNDADLLVGDFNEVDLADLADLPCGQAFRSLCHLVLVVESHGAVAKDSLSTAAIRAPMHGILFCQRSILAQLPFRDLANNRKWRHLVSRLLEVCLHVADLVSPVVTSSSPEGHTLDQDQHDDEKGGLGPDDVVSEGHVFAPPAQALLVCCWRTMKEVALLLGELSQQAPIMLHEEGDNGLLTPDQVRKIGEFFTVILLTSKHRGAFELAYTGFVKLCGRLWKSEDACLCALPQKWLRSLLQDITSAVPSEVLCGTRRSAGVPFLVQAIVATEPPSACRACLKTVTKELMEMASKTVEELNTTDSLLPQVHARNILRALFRDTRLGEDVFPFVADGVAVALQGFLSDSWAVRNSSTLLFSALVTRIFGVKKTKDENSRRNCMTGREFFSRFPDLHAFLLEQLKEACEAFEREGGIHPSLYPVLLILSRLYPSSMDGVDSALNMAPFIPYVIRCGKSSVMKTRAMAARAIVPLVSGVSLMQTLQDLVLSLPPSDAAKVNQNQVHGALLQILHVIRGHIIDVKCTRPIVKQIATNFIPRLEQFTWIATRSNPCPITRSVFLEIAFKLLLDWTWMDVPGMEQTEVTELATQHIRPLRDIFITLAIHEACEWHRDPQSPSGVILVGEVFVKEIIAKICLEASAGYELETLACFGSKTRYSDEKRPEKGAESRDQESHDQESRDVTLSHLESPDLGACVSCLVPATPSALILTLLGSPEYEVRQVVLDYLSSRLRVRVLPVSVGSPGSKHCDKKSEWLASECQREEISMQLYEMALTNEEHPECLSKVFEVLCCLPETCVFPWKLKCGKELSILQCWQFSVTLISKRGQRADMKCVLLDFLVMLVPQMYKRINEKKPGESSLSRQALRDFLDIILDTSAPSESVEVRQKTAEVLGRSDMRDVFLGSFKTLGELPFRLWSVVLELLQDDDMSVRESMAGGVSRHLQKHTCADCVDLPTLAMQKVLDTVLENFIDTHPGPCFRWILGLVCGDVDSNSPDVDYDACAEDASSSDVSDMDRLFEKGSLNNYGEDCALSRLAWDALKERLQARHEVPVSDEPEVSELVFYRSKCLAKLDNLRGVSLTSNARVFSFVYRSLLGLLAVGRLERIGRFSAAPDVAMQHMNDAVREQLVGFVGEICNSQESSGFSFHPILRTCLEELCGIHKVEIHLSA